MLGHAVREVTVSRGNKEGNNAFLLQENYHDVWPYETIPYAVKKDAPMDFLLNLVNHHKSVSF